MTKICTLVDIQLLITYATFVDERLRGLGVARGRISGFPFTFVVVIWQMLSNIHDIWQQYTAIDVKQNVLFLITPAECCYTTLSVIMLSRRYVHALQIQIDTDSLTITTIMSRDPWALKPKSVGCDTVSTTRLILGQVSSHSDEGYTRTTYTHTSEQSDHNINATVSYVEGADFQRTWMNFSESTIVWDLTRYYAQPLIGGALSDDFVWRLSETWHLSDVCLSRTSGLSREQKGLGRPKLAHR